MLSLPSDGSYAIGQSASDSVVIVEDAPPAVTIQATTPTADVQTGAAGSFTVTRNSGLAADLTVQYSIGGTAVSGEQYQQLSGSVVIPAGEASATVDVVPIDSGQAFQPDAYPTVALGLLASSTSSYTVVSPSNDTVTIEEDAAVAERRVVADGDDRRYAKRGLRAKRLARRLYRVARRPGRRAARGPIFGGRLGGGRRGVPGAFRLRDHPRRFGDGRHHRLSDRGGFGFPA